MRLTSEQRNRAKRCARYLGKPMTALARDALLEKIRAVEEIQRTDAERKTARRRARKPRGLGLGPEFIPTAAAAAAAAPTKIEENDLEERLVLYVVAAEDDTERSQRMKTALQIVYDSSPATGAETSKSAERLKEQVRNILDRRKEDPLFGTIIQEISSPK